jgi:hypothetical protein
MPGTKPSGSSPWLLYPLLPDCAQTCQSERQCAGYSNAIAFRGLYLRRDPRPKWAPFGPSPQSVERFTSNVFEPERLCSRAATRPQQCRHGAVLVMRLHLPLSSLTQQTTEKQQTRPDPSSHSFGRKRRCNRRIRQRQKKCASSTRMFSKPSLAACPAPGRCKQRPSTPVSQIQPGLPKDRGRVRVRFGCGSAVL